MKKILLLLVALALTPAWGTTIVYNNSTSDTGLSAVFSAGPYTQLGDLVTLGGTDRLLTKATVQFYDLAQLGSTFDASMSIFDSSQNLLGTSSLLGITASTLSFNVTFNFANLPVPNNLLFLVSVSNYGTMDLGLNLFDAPSPGSSDSTEFWVEDGTIHTVSANTGEGNLYLTLEATSAESGVPEPSTLLLTLSVLPGLIYFARRRAPRK